jgi:hypothetical protein
MQRIVRIIIALCMFAAVDAHAAKISQMPLDVKVAKSDLVVIGEVMSVTVDASRNDSKWATVQVEHILKGSRVTTIIVYADTDIVEEFMPCCKIGERYLFFLEKIPGNRYASVNSGFGVYPIGPNAGRWPSPPPG